MLSMLIAWDANGDVMGTLDSLVVKRERTPEMYDDLLAAGALIVSTPGVALLDFDAFEAAGGKFRDIAEASNAVGSGTWPEWLGSQAHDFKVELDPNPGPARARIKALIHKSSNVKRKRSDIEAAIEERIKDANGKPADIRDLVGGPDRPLLLDEDGRTKPKVKVARPNLPVIGRG